MSREDDDIYRPTDADRFRNLPNPDVSGGPHPADPGVEEMIKDVDSYDPTKVETKVLLDDWRIANAWYSSMVSGIKIKHSKETVINIAKNIYTEMKKRGIRFSPDMMKPHSKELFRIITGQVTPQKLNELEEVKYFRNFSIIKNAISLVGSSVNSRFEEYHDLDIHIKLEEPKNSYIRRAVETRIWKMFPPETRGKLHFVWGDPQGSHDEFIPLYDLALIRTSPQIVEMYDLTDIRILHPFPPLKTMVRTFFTPQEASEYVFKEAKWQKVVLEKKFDGFRLQVHRKGNEIRVFTDHENDVTHAFPMHVKHAFELSDKDFVLDCEAVPYGPGNRPLGRSPMAKYIASVKSGKDVDDTSIVFHTFDIVYFNGADITQKPWSERKKVLSSLKFTSLYKEVSSIVTENEEKLKSTAKMLGDLTGSEGAMIKKYDSEYSTTGKSDDWVKYKVLQLIKARVIKVNKLESASAVNYEVGIDIIPSQESSIDESYIVDEKGKKVLKLGNTFNTKEKADVGDIVEVQVEEVWRHKTDKGIHYSIHKPHFHAAQPLSDTTTLEELDALVSSRGAEIVSPKNAEEPTGEGEGRDKHEIKNFSTRMQSNFRKVMEKDEKPRFIMQWHHRGDSVHTDIRHEIPGTKILEGITVDTPGNTTQEDRLTDTVDGARCEVKVPEPHEWISFEGISGIGDVGATTHKPALFVVVAKGTYKVKAVDDHRIIIEYFTDSGETNRSLIHRAGEMSIPVSKHLPDKLKQLHGNFLFQIAHLPKGHVILVKHLKGDVHDKSDNA